MLEPSTACRECGAVILQRTADNYDGLCVPCHRKAALTPPADFVLPPDIVEHLDALDLNQEYFRDMTWQEGTEFTHDFLNRVEESNGLCAKWTPRLAEFAATCRTQLPPPLLNSLSATERAQQKIYAEKLQSTDFTSSRRVAICQIPLLAIAVARQLWPQDNDRVFLLTPDERRRWDEMYLHPEGAMPWFSYYWWSIDTMPGFPFSMSELDEFNIRDDDYSLADGECRWYLDFGEMHGSLNGGGRTELWAWNGNRARFVAEIGMWDS